jgi:hypothetical protein
MAAVEADPLSEKIELRSIRSLQETQRSTPTRRCNHRYFCGILDTFLEPDHDPDIEQARGVLLFRAAARCG